MKQVNENGVENDNNENILDGFLEVKDPKGASIKYSAFHLYYSSFA